MDSHIFQSSGGGGGASDYVSKTADYTAVDKDQLLGDTSGAAFTITLPASPTVGNFVVIADAKGTWATNNLTVGRNGQLIESTAANLVADVNGVQITLVFVGGGVGWRVLYQMAQASGTGATIAHTANLISGDNAGNGSDSGIPAVGVLGQRLSGRGSSAPVWSFNNIRKWNFSASPAGATTSGNGTNPGINFDCTSSYISPAGVATDFAQRSVGGIAGQPSGSGAGNAAQPVILNWTGSCYELATNTNYGIFIGETGTNGTLSVKAWGVRVIDNNTLQLVVHDGSTLHTQNFTVAGFLTTGATPSRQRIVLVWDGASKLDLYASFNTATGGAMPTLSYIGTLTQAISGSLGGDVGIIGVYATGTATFSTAPQILTFNVTTEET